MAISRLPRQRIGSVSGSPVMMLRDLPGTGTPRSVWPCLKCGWYVDFLKRPFRMAATVILAPAVLLLIGCVPKQLVVEERPLQTVSLEELVELQRERSLAIRTVRALMTVRPRGERSFTASLEFSRNGNDGSPAVRIKGFSPLGRTVFRLEADPDRSTIFHNGRSIEVRPDDPEPDVLPVSAVHFFDSILAVAGMAIREEETPVLEEAGRHYIIHVLRVSNGNSWFSRRLWFEREDLRLIRVELFNEPGASERPVSKMVLDLSNIQIRQSAEGGTISWPFLVRVAEIQSGGGPVPSMELEFKEIHFNEARKTGAYRSGIKGRTG